MKRLFALIMVCCMMGSVGYAQSDMRKRFEERRARQKERFEKKRSEQQKKFDEFRRKQNERYVGKLRNKWKEYQAAPTLQLDALDQPKPKEYEEEILSPDIHTGAMEVLTLDMIPMLSTLLDTVAPVHDTIQTTVDTIPHIQNDTIKESEKPKIQMPSEQDTVQMAEIIPTKENLSSEIDLMALSQIDTLLPSPLSKDTVLSKDAASMHETISTNILDTIAQPSQEIDSLSKVKLDSLMASAHLVKELEVEADEEVWYIPEPEPQAQPMVPIQPLDEKQERISISLYGTMISIAFPLDADLELYSVDEIGISYLWQQMTDTVVPSKFDVAIMSCLNAREFHKLCDWAYLQMVQEVAKQRYEDPNVATIFAGYILAHSGYNLRIGYSEDETFLLMASHHEIYYKSRFLLENDEWYYLVNGNLDGKNCYISDVGYHSEKKMSMYIIDNLNIDSDLTELKLATSYKGWSLPVQTNKNIIDFYDDYPRAGVFVGDPYSTWLITVRTPLDKATREVLYPELQKMIEGLTPWQAVAMLLNWVQTAFTYKEDPYVWGTDRIFFADETLYYPLSDCEDRAILFTKLVRDLLDLDVLFLYYEAKPHLSTAVHFPVEEGVGEYVMYNNKKYIVCDPTLRNGPIGRTMSFHKGVSPRIIVVD